MTVQSEIDALPPLPEPHFSGPEVLKEAQAWRARLDLLHKYVTAYLEDVDNIYANSVGALDDLRAVSAAIKEHQ